MRITVPKPNIELYVDGFEGHDQLKRKSQSKDLSDLVEKIDEPLVISLDGQWGSGKSFFLKCWAGAHTSENDGTATTIYYDAFRDDYLDDPLSGLLTNLLNRFPEKNTTTKLQRLKSAATNIAKPAARIALSLGTAGLSEIASPIVDAGLAKAGDEASSYVDKVWQLEKGKREAMADFRGALRQLTEPDEHGNPTKKFVFIVDELDRCRPDFALQLLEIVKHFFDVPGWHFVLGVHLGELRNTVLVRYGDKVDADLYLSKFISVTLRLRDVTRYDEIENSEINRYFSAAAKGMELPDETVSHVLWWAKNFRNMRFTSIRNCQRILTEIALLPAEKLHNGYSLTIGALVIFKHNHKATYDHCCKSEVQLSEIQNILEIPDTGIENLSHPQQVANFIWRSFLAPHTVVDKEYFRDMFGMFGLRDPETAFANLISSRLEAITLGIAKP